MKLKKIKELLSQMEQETGIQHDILIRKDGSGVLKSTEFYNRWPFIDLHSLQFEVEEYIKNRHNPKEEPKPRENFEVGDVVYYAGVKGKVTDTNHYGDKPIRVIFEINNSVWYVLFLKSGHFEDKHIEPLLLTESEYLASKK